jgi:hypothetical protein
MAGDPKDAQARAEAQFKKRQKETEDSQRFWAEQAAEARTVDAKTARLRALRLAKETAEHEAAEKEKQAKADEKQAKAEEKLARKSPAKRAAKPPAAGKKAAKAPPS